MIADASTSPASHPKPFNLTEALRAHFDKRRDLS